MRTAAFLLIAALILGGCAAPAKPAEAPTESTAMERDSFGGDDGAPKKNVTKNLTGDPLVHRAKVDLKIGGHNLLNGQIRGAINSQCADIVPAGAIRNVTVVATWSAQSPLDEQLIIESRANNAGGPAATGRSPLTLKMDLEPTTEPWTIFVRFGDNQAGVEQDVHLDFEVSHWDAKPSVGLC